ncbi:MAG: long-chain-fatty-acid--CoA ligase [Candidatus Omnitrophica bacterium]|nr:long-chain-fatty-acid--CoA ligase [Candidatus Omnitrophota bacterium]
MNLVSLLEVSARKFSWRKCLVSDSGILSFRALNKRVNQLSFGLKEKLGVKKGDKVAVLLDNCPEFIITVFAILKTGAVCIPLNVFLAAEELKYVLKDSRARLLISSSTFLETIQKIDQDKQNDLYLEDIILTDQKRDGFIKMDQIVFGDKGDNPSLEINPDDLALLIYTSGTTGFPKGVMLSHKNLTSNVSASLSALKITPRDRLLLVLPMFHTFTLTVCILVPICAGARTVIIKSIRPFQKVLRSILLNRITMIVGIPQLFDIFKNLSIPTVLQWLLQVRLCISGAAPLGLDTLKVFKEKFKRIILLEGYGLTEASPVVSLNPLQGIQKAGSIGLALPGVETKVVREDESEAESDEIGELIVKGPNVMMGYLNQPQETAKTIRGSWLFTGDMAKIDSEKYIYIVGRKKEMILIHGMNVYPQEIENVLSTHPKLKEVAVVGKKDKSKGEIPVAFVVLEKDCQVNETEIINYCKEKLANYKIPRLIEFRDQLPKTPTGKVLKRKLV